MYLQTGGRMSGSELILEFLYTGINSIYDYIPIARLTGIGEGNRFIPC